MKIALWNNLPSGGGKRAFHAMVAGLIARGHELESWCPLTACRDYEPLAALMPEHLVDYTVHPRKRWQRLLPGRFGHGRQFWEMERHASACAAQINAGGFDVCLVANCQEFAVPPIGRHLRIPTVHYCQELWRGLHEADLSDVPPEGKGMKRRLSRLIQLAWQNSRCARERRDLAAFDRILVNSYYSRESVLRAHGQECEVCYLGIDTERFQGSGGERSRTVVGLGALQPHKDPRTAIEALATIPEAERPELIWIGNVAQESYANELKSLAQERGVRFTVRVRVTDQELVAVLNRAAVMLYTSRLEPFGFAPLEANACGVPVVAIAEGGVRETVRDGYNGRLVPDRNPRALGEAVLDLLWHPDEARQLGEQGRQWVKANWGWDKCVLRLERALLEVTRR